MTSQTVYTVAELTEKIAEKLEYAPELKAVWVKGEIAECTRSSMGHWYFNLKDANSILKVVLFSSQARNLKFTLTSGMEVLVKGSVAVYRARGAYQLLATEVESAGQGAYRKALLELTERLDEGGYFAKKRPLPEYPFNIGVVTSKTGAAIYDISRVVGKRWPLANLKLFGCLVQGTEAPPSIIKALNKAYQSNLDILILARGGGSSEDLWAFNDEEVAKTLFNSPFPTITGVGHEIDRTIVDLVADYAAPTPSGAAEVAVPDIDEVRALVNSLDRNLKSFAREILMLKEKHLTHLFGVVLQHEPKKELARLKERLNSLELLLNAKALVNIEEKNKRFLRTLTSLEEHNPQNEINRLSGVIKEQSYRLDMVAFDRLRQLQERFKNFEYGLELLNPENVLKKGYAVVFLDNQLVRSIEAVSKGDRITVKFTDGYIKALVEVVGREGESENG